ncbi:MAG TPA: hypothetical protein VGQ81_10895 [Acidobacteriota bacterium]|nr:hypothetical protein [Acidobacteriota bacterium]
MFGNQKGEGRVGCLLVLLLAVVFGYASFKIIPIYIDKMNFDEQLAREASKAGAGFWTDEKIKQDVLQIAHFRGFEMGEDDITVSRTRSVGGEVRIETKYKVTADFPGYIHVFKFESKSSSIVGSF